MVTSRIRPDILIRNPNGELIAVVEIKNRQSLTQDVATTFRQNMLKNGLLTYTPYFLLVSQDMGFLWKEEKVENLDAPPTYVFPMSNIITRYLKREPGERLYEAEMELLLLHWLGEISNNQLLAVEEPEKTLELAGFTDAIKGATIVSGEYL